MRTIRWVLFVLVALILGACNDASPSETGEEEQRITITTPTLVDGYVNHQYSQRLSAAGLQSTIGGIRFSWLVSEGVLPPGLALSGGGFHAHPEDLLGVPLEAGTYSFTLKVRQFNASMNIPDSTRWTAERRFTLRIRLP